MTFIWGIAAEILQTSWITGKAQKCALLILFLVGVGKQQRVDELFIGPNGLIKSNSLNFAGDLASRKPPPLLYKAVEFKAPPIQDKSFAIKELRNKSSCRISRQSNFSNTFWSLALSVQPAFKRARKGIRSVLQKLRQREKLIEARCQKIIIDWLSFFTR